MKIRSSLAALALLGLSTGAAATTMIRQGLEDLTRNNSLIVVGKVVEARSHWNSDGSFILTDVRVRAQDVLKGDAARGSEFTLTLLGGSVGGLTTMIVSGAELHQNRRYVLFMDRGELPGASQVLTVRDHSQAVFELVDTDEGMRAISQADPHALVPDAQGRSDIPGGSEGLPLEALRAAVRGQVEVRP